MELSITLSAYAKINLYLDILSRRENGYHNRQSIMQAVDLCDTVTMTRLADGEGIRVESSLADLPTDRRNLAYRAAERFSTLLGRIPDVAIRIEKRIPMAAGLGGGSADAAAVLRGLNRLYGTDAPVSRLCEIGAGLGADIPFCIVGGAMIAEGIGEIQLLGHLRVPFRHGKANGKNGDHTYGYRDKQPLADLLQPNAPGGGGMQLVIVVMDAVITALFGLTSS